MKNFINYYFEFHIMDIHLLDGKYFFTYQNQNYMFKPFYGNMAQLEAIHELNQQISFTNPFYHKLVYNKDKSLVTRIDQKPYVMLKLSNVSNDIISIFDIKGQDYVQTSKKLDVLNMFHWTTLWESKIDYFEQQIFSKVSEYTTILPSFHYFIGLGENAILYVNEIMGSGKQDYMDQLVASHRRFYKNTTLIDFYDPTNLIVDHKARDSAEYMKCLFLTGDYDMDIITEYLDKLELSIVGAHLLFARILFPSFYFDFLENLIVRNDYESFYMMEERIEEYQLFLSDVFQILSHKYPIQEIPWLTKKI